MVYSAVYVDLTTDSGLELTPAPDRLLTTGAGDNTRYCRNNTTVLQR